MLRITVLLVLLWFSGCSAQYSVNAVRSLWAEPMDTLWFIAKVPNRMSSLAYAAQQQKQASMVYIDKLPLSNGTSPCAMLFSNQHVGIAAGFSALDFDSISLARLTRRAQENRQRNIVPVSVCGFEEIDGSIKFETIWMPSKTIEYQLQFDNLNQTMENFQSQGYYAVSVCSTKMFSTRQVTPSVVIIWHRLRNAPQTRTLQRISVDISESDCSSANLTNSNDHFFLISMQLFNKGNDVRCSAVWQYMTASSLRSELKIGDAPYDVANLIDKQMLPRQISIYRNNMGREQIMVLWTNYETRNISFDGNFYNGADNVPINWLPGSTTGMKAEDQDYFEKTVIEIMRSTQIPAISFAVSKNEQLKRAVTFGYANPLTKEAATVTTKFRMGSISKVVTSAAIFSLIDQGKLSLDSTVFGPDSILGTEYGTQPYSKFLLDVKVVHLLEHSSGGWGAAAIKDTIWIFDNYNQSAFIGISIDQYGPTVQPGTTFDYANFGYYLLGVIITKISGKPYEEYVREYFWRPAGVPDSNIGIENRWFSERQPNEAVFYADGSMSTVDSYDLVDPLRMNSEGGWITSPIDFLRVATRFNGFYYKPDTITQASFAQMTQPSAALRYTCRGWFKSLDMIGFGHSGYYPGGHSYYERYNNGVEVMAMLSKGDDSADMAETVTSLRRLFTDLTVEWPQQDLFSNDSHNEAHSAMHVQIFFAIVFSFIVFIL